MKSKTVFVYCQYLLGIGHMQRCSLVVQALVRHGFDVHVALGGAPVEQISFGDATLHYLTPLRANNDSFSALVHTDGRLFSEQDKQQRSADLLALVQRLAPDAMIIETFPFGRRTMRFELLPLLEWSRAQQPKPLIISSIRDILQRRKPKREIECLEYVERFFDKVWVHGDPELIPLQESFPPVEQVIDKLSYTGYVAPPANDILPSKDGILISAGGGACGTQLMRCALELFNSGYAQDKHWTLTTGPHLDGETVALLQSVQSPRFEVHRFLPNLRDYMARSEVSVSLAGYNTTMDVLRSGSASVMVPFIGTEETEQLQRAKFLHDRQRVVCLHPDQLSKDTLAQSIDTALSHSFEDVAIDLQGADNAAQQLQVWLAEHNP